jgi:tRNA(fMet)-specific endonuclease VapC
VTLRYMLDTDICIAVIKNRPIALLDRFNDSADQLCISCITLGELFFGAEKSRRRDDNIGVIEQFVARLAVLDLTQKAAVHYGQLRADLHRAEKIIGSNDMLIAGHARSEGLTLVTNSVREFERAPGLLVENWLSF